ncbi:hypothetical protein B0H34DRAFT_687447 [Crassisporium funariophilum]|nr:hypothetical protein B0H34DRAFT_687447 [Crassisporium funariophilum]
MPSCPRALILTSPFITRGIGTRLLSDNVSSKSLSAKYQVARRKHLISVLVAFGAGAAIYFFLPDPSRAAPTLDDVSLSYTHFTPTRVISNQVSGPNTKLLRIAIPRNLLPAGDTTDIFGPIWSVYIKDDDIQVERPYTPLQGIDADGQMLFWVKKYPNGEVGRWLHSKNSGDEIELRGPIKTWSYKEDEWDEIVMISGGTGITPFVQLFHNVISNPISTSKSRFTLLHSSAVSAELPPPPVLEPLVAFAAEHPEKFRIHVFVDEQDYSTSPLKLPRVNIGRITDAALHQCLAPENETVSWWSQLFRKTAKIPRRTLFLVCGPEPMIRAVAGPYGRNLSQGAVGGILGRMGITSEQVYKL